MLSTQSRFNVSDRNLAVIIAKEQSQKWGAEMKIEAIPLSDFKELLSEQSSISEDEPLGNDVSAASTMRSDDAMHGGSSILTNTLMYDLS